MLFLANDVRRVAEPVRKVVQGLSTCIENAEAELDDLLRHYRRFVSATMETEGEEAAASVATEPQ